MAGSKRVNSLQALLTRDGLLQIADDRYFARGEDYVRRGYVHDLAVEGDGLTARVTGTEDYYVELLYGYQTLKTRAERLNQWEIWREKALAYIRQQLEPPKPPPQPPKVTQTSRSRKSAQVRSVASYPAWNASGMCDHDRSLLVEIFLWEGKMIWLGRKPKQVVALNNFG